MTLGILLISGWEERPAFLRPDVPYFRASLERSGNMFLDGTIEGKVLSGEKKEDRYVLTVRPEEENRNVLVYVDAAKEAVSELIGTEARFEGRFFLFRRATNFGEFDVRAYYDALGISGGFLSDAVKPGNGKKDFFRALAFDVRESVRETVEYYGGDGLGMRLALLLSDKSALPEEVGNTLKATGLLFLLSSSGMLFSFFGSAVFLFFKKRMKNRIVPVMISALTMLFLGILSGFSFSFLRGFIVFLVRISASCFKRKFDLLSAFSLSLIILLLARPESVFLPAFRYAAALMAALGAIVPVVSAYFFKCSGRELAVLRFFSMKCAFLPLTVAETFRPGFYVFFGEAMLVVLRAVITLLSFFAIAGDWVFGRGNGFSTIVFQATDRFAGWYGSIPGILRNLPFQAWVNGRPSFVRIGVYVALLLSLPVILRICLIRRKYRKESEERIPGKGGRRAVLLFFPAVFLFGTLFLHVKKPAGDEIRLTMADVGQGDGFILESSGTVVTIDGGSTDRDDAGEILQNTLHYYGRSRIDAAFISHDDRDHYSAVSELLKRNEIRIDRIYLPFTKKRANEFTEIRSAALSAGVPVYYLKAGDRVDMGPFSFDVLWPLSGAEESGNDTSLVLSVHAGSTSYLFMGDVSEETERKLTVGRHGFLKVAHHGSKFSSSERFLEKVSPEIAFISYGQYNTYGHPAPETVSRVLKETDVLFLSGRDGAVSVLSGPGRGAVLYASPN